MVLIAAKKYCFDSYPNTYNCVDNCFLQLSVNFKTLITPKILCEKFQFGKNLRSLLTREQCRAVIVVEEEETEGDATLCTISMGIDTFRNFHANHLQIHFDRASFGNEATVGNMFQLLANYNCICLISFKKIHNRIELVLK